MTDGGKVGQEGVGAGRGGLSSHTRASDLFVAVACVSVSSGIVYKIFRGQPISQLGWDGQPPRLHPEFWGNSRTSGNILRVQVRPESLQLLWELGA